MVNLDNISFIGDSNGKKAVILSIETYEKIKEKLEELEDINSYIESKNTPEELFPIEMVEKLVLGQESKIKVLREYRGYSLTKLANFVNITESYLSQIEHKKRKGNIELYKKIAEALNIEVDLII